MSDAPLTIRLDGDGVTVSGDDGSTWSVPECRGSALREICAVPPPDPGAPRAPSLSAAARGVLAEASSLTLVASPGGGERSAPVDVGTAAARCALAPLELPASRPLREILAERQSVREFEPPGLSELATVLVRAGRLRGWRGSSGGPQEQTRALPSAGACHPIELEVLTAGFDGLDAGRWVFDPATCVLRRVEACMFPDELACSLAERGFRAGGGFTLILAVARFDRTLRRYSNGASLVWRDAGVALAGLHLCAADVGLASCIVADAATVRRPADGGVDLGGLLLGRPSRAA